VCLPFFIEAPFLRLSLLELLNYAWRRLSRAGQYNPYKQSNRSGIVMVSHAHPNIDVVDVTKLCSSFPVLPEDLVVRDNLIQAIETAFEEGNEVVFVSGHDGLGKTTLLGQFAKAHSLNTFCLFVNASARLAADPEYLKFELCNQMHWFLYSTTLPENLSEDAAIRTLTLELHKRAVRKKQFYYVVVGSPITSDVAGALCGDILPLRLPTFKFVISGDTEAFRANLQGVRTTSFRLPPFSLDESRKYLSALVSDQELIHEIHLACRGIPANLASVRRLLLSGINVDQLRQEMPNTLSGWYELEWRATANASESVQMSLALMAFSRYPLFIQDLSALLGVQSEGLETELRILPFLRVEENKEIIYTSEAFRSFAANRLADRREPVNQLILDNLQAHQTTRRAFTFLPGYLEEAGRHEDLISFLSTEHLELLFSEAKTLAPVQRSIEYGIRTAKRIGKTADLIRFGLALSSLFEVTAFDVMASEIEARIAVGEHERALALANSAVLNEDRLHLLAIVSKRKRHDGLSPEPELRDEIKRLSDSIDFSTLGERAINIAADLVATYPELAVRIVERATNTPGDENALDLAFARLSLNAVAADAENAKEANISQDISARIKDPGLKRLSTEAFFLVGEYSTNEILAQAERIERTSDALYLVSRWSVRHHDTFGAEQVIDYALRRALKTTEYAPNGLVLRRLATPLPKIATRKPFEGNQLLALFDAQVTNAARLGPTIDIIRLRILLAETLSVWDERAAIDRFEDIYLGISTLTDLPAKGEALGWLWRSLIENPSLPATTTAHLNKAIEADLVQALDGLLTISAEQIGAFRGVLRALAPAQFSFCKSYIKRLNTQMRRNVVAWELLRSLLDSSSSELNSQHLSELVSVIDDEELVAMAILSIVARLAETGQREVKITELWAPLVSRAVNIRSLAMRSKACSLAFSALSRANCCTSLQSTMRVSTKEAWDSLTDVWERVDLGFELAGTFANCDREEAKRYLSESEAIRKGTMLASAQAGTAYVALLRLAIRACAGLVRKNLVSKEDLSRLSALVANVPSPSKRIGLMAELAIRISANGDANLSKQLVAEHIRPVLVPTLPENSDEELVSEIAPALYVFHKQTALERIQKLCPVMKDRALERICDFLITKLPFDEPRDAGPWHAWQMTYEEMVDVLELLPLMSSDSSIFWVLKNVADSADSGIQQATLSREQRLDIGRRVEEVAKSQFPRVSGISHEGYRWVSLARSFRLRNVDGQAWKELIDDADRVPNMSDRAFVLADIACSIPPRFHSLAAELFERARSIASAIPSVVDQLGQYEHIAVCAGRSDSLVARQSIRQAMESVRASLDPDLIPTQRRLVDLAYRFDPEFASSLVSALDDDPAREDRRARLLRKDYKSLETRRKLLESASSSCEDDVSPSVLSREAWRLLGKTHSGRVSTMSLEVMRRRLESVSHLPFHRSYPALAWIVESAVQRFGTTDQARTELIPIFDATLIAAGLCARVAAKAVGVHDGIRRFAASSVSGRAFPIGPGKRVDALVFIRDWMQEKLRDYVKICDPFFGPDELEIVRLVLNTGTECTVSVLTSRKHQLQSGVPQPWDQSYRDFWRLRISDLEPPETDIVIVGTKSGGELPVHDRWILTRGSGLRLGTSLNSIGKNRYSEISVLSSDEAEELEKIANSYLFREKRDHEGERLQYAVFTLN
jgi:hypothetical protein